MAYIYTPVFVIAETQHPPPKIPLTVLWDQGFRTAFLDPNGLLNTMPTDIARWGAFIQRTFWGGKVWDFGPAQELSFTHGIFW